MIGAHYMWLRSTWYSLVSDYLIIHIYLNRLFYVVHVFHSHGMQLAYNGSIQPMYNKTIDFRKKISELSGGMFISDAIKLGHLLSEQLFDFLLSYYCILGGPLSNYLFFGFF